MKIASASVMVSAITLALLASLSAVPQGDKKSNPAENTPSSSSNSTASAQTKLIEATRVSTEEAARKAAEAESKKKQASEKAGTEKDTMKSIAPDVSEIQPVAKTGGGSDDALRLPTEESKKSPLKDVHGSVYGTLDSGGSGNGGTGANIGASTKNKKAHIYVETNRSRTDSGTPH